MEPPRKRPRVSNLTKQDALHPDFDLEESRARNDLRLKSTFEAIFKKYEHDFTGIGDEIDLHTGEIVVNNGHIRDMGSERDTGDRIAGSSRNMRAPTSAIGEERRPRDTASLLSDDFERLSSPEPKQAKVYADMEVQSDDDVDSLLGSEHDTDLPTESYPRMKDMSDAGENARDGKPRNEGSPFRHLPSRQAILSQFGPILGLQIANPVSNVGNTNFAPVEEAWCVPDLPSAPPARRPIFNSLIDMRRRRSLSPLNQTSIWAPPRSTGRRRKDGFVDIGKSTPTFHSSPTIKAKAPIADNTQMESRNGNYERVLFGDGSHHPHPKRKLHESPLRHLPSYQENGPELYTNERSNTFSDHQIEPQQVNRKASYTTPNPSPLHVSKTLQNSQVSPLKRKELQQPKHTAATLSEGGPSIKKLDHESHIRSERITTQHPGARLQELVSPCSNPSPLHERKRLTYCARWTLPEEELLWHLKENTDLDYTQLVKYFPARTKANIRTRYLLMAPRSKLRSGDSKASQGPPYTLQEDELLRELRSEKGLAWKDIMTSFPTRTINSLKMRYCRILQRTPHSTKTTALEGSTSATSEGLLHIGPTATSLGVTASEQKVPEGRTNTGSLVGEHTTPQRFDAAGPRVFCEVADTVEPLLPSIEIEKTPLGDRTPKLDLPSSPSFKVVVETNTSKRRQHIAHGEGVKTPMAIPDADDRFQSRGKDVSVEASPLKRDLIGVPKSSQKKISQSRPSKYTPTTDVKQRVTKPRKSQGSGRKASPKTLTPRSQAALVSLLGDVTDDEDELSRPATTGSGSKDLPLTTANRTPGQGCMGSKSCDRKFCFKCM